MSNGMATKAPESLALQITKENNMASRTAEGKHTTRFIVLKKSSNNGDTKFVRSIKISMEHQALTQRHVAAS